MQNNLKEAIVSRLKQLGGGNILDIPSGNCWLQKELDPSQWQYYPADYYLNSTVINFRQADLNQALPYPDLFFDYVACFEGLEHAENYHLILREFYRILKPGGTVLISTPNPLSIKSRMRFLLTGTFRGFPHLKTMPKEGEHVHISPINLSFLITFAEKYGFALERLHKIKIKRKNLRFLLHYVLLKMYFWVKFFATDRENRLFYGRLYSSNVLLNDNVLVSFFKR